MASGCSPGSLREAVWGSMPGSRACAQGRQGDGRQTGWDSGRSSWRDKQGPVGKRHGVVQWLLDHCRVKLRVT